MLQVESTNVSLVLKAFIALLKVIESACLRRIVQKDFTALKKLDYKI